MFEPNFPKGFQYRPEFISEAAERTLVTAIDDVAFSNFEMRGMKAKRRIASFGLSYGAAEAPPIPAFLFSVRSQIAEWAVVPAEQFAMVLINEYRPATPIGWHRDAPQYDIVAGISLLSACRMTFRPYLSASDLKPARRSATHEILLDARSAYLITGDARQAYEHHIPPVEHLRYSVTFRTLRRRGLTR